MAQLTLTADAASIKFQTGFATDIGGGRENQDDGFIWTKKEYNLIVLGMLDGHGREVGRTAAVAAKSCLLELLDKEYDQLLKSPVEFLIYAHQRAHEHIKHMFTLEFEKQGYQVKLTEEGYLLKRRSPYDNWSCVHGGAACTLLALIGTELYSANVGDSTALICAPYPIFTPQTLCIMRDAAAAESCRSIDSCSTECTRQLILTAEHSPESSYEYQRLRAFRSRDDDPMQPALYVVYDSASHDKSQCSPVFDSRQPVLCATQRGSYFKNVRKEWASLVSTPISALFQDALAFTRSLGDLHLHTYGVTHMPEVHRVDLAPLFAGLQAIETSQKEDSTSSSTSCDGVASRMNQTLCVVVATDGVWDNWLYEDVAKFVMDESCLRATNAAPEGAQRVTTSFMHRNTIFARRNFGNQADNATGIIMYISLSPDFPV